MCCKCFFRCFPKRYFLALLGFILLVLSFGTRAVFTLSLTHVVRIITDNGTKQNATDDQCPLPDSQVIYWHLWQKSMVLTGYFIGYVITQIPGGILAQRIPAYRVFGGSCLMSFILFIILPFTMKVNWVFPFVIRVIQGLIEGATMPAINGVLSHWARSGEKSRIMTMICSGAYLSAAIGFFVTGFVSCHVSWNAIYFIFGGLGIVVTTLWFSVVRERPLDDPMIATIEKNHFIQTITGKIGASGAANTAGIPWKSIIFSLPVSAILVASFCRSWVFYLLLTEQPPYFKDVFKWSVTKIGYLSALPHIAMTIIVIIGGFLADACLKKQLLSRTAVRKLFNCGGFGLEGLSLIALSFIPNNNAHDPVIALVIMTFGVGVSGFAVSGYQVNPHDIAPDRVSVISGIVKMGGISGIIVPPLVDFMTKHHTYLEWATVLRLTAGIHLGGVLYFASFASGERQKWSNLVPESITSRLEPTIQGTNQSIDDEEEPIMPRDDGIPSYERAWYNSVRYGATAGAGAQHY